MKDELIKYINEELIADDQTTINESDDLLEDGLIDSLGIMRLIAFVEEQFDTSVPPEDMTIEHFQNVEAMVQYLESKN